MLAFFIYVTVYFIVEHLLIVFRIVIGYDAFDLVREIFSLFTELLECL